MEEKHTWKTKELNDQNFEILYDGLKNPWHVFIST